MNKKQYLKKFVKTARKTAQEKYAKAHDYRNPLSLEESLKQSTLAREWAWAANTARLCLELQSCKIRQFGDYMPMQPVIFREGDNKGHFGRIRGVAWSDETMSQITGYHVEWETHPIWGKNSLYNHSDVIPENVIPIKVIFVSNIDGIQFLYHSKKGSK